MPGRWRGTTPVSSAIDEQRGELYFSETTPPDFEDARGSGTDGQEYQVTVRASDGSLSGTLAVTVTVTDVNEGPEVRRSGRLFGSPAGSVPENQAQDTALARYTATDPEDNAATITLWSTSGRDGGDFVINEQGELRFRSAPDYERPADSDGNNIYEVTIRASDGRYTGTLEETQVITVTPVNEAPEITTNSTSATEMRHPENRISRLYTYRATDPERGTIAWSLAGDHASFFTIDEQRGELYFSETTPPDYETPQGSGINRPGIPGDGACQRWNPDRNSHNVTVTVTDVNEGPDGDLWRRQPSPSRRTATGQGQASRASDPEGQTISRWNLGGRDGGDFTITETGLMTFRQVPDYERPADSDHNNIYEVEVRPYDGRYYGSHQVTVTVGDVTEITGIAAITRPENFEGTLATYSAGGRVDLVVEPAWRLTGTDSGDFTIDEDGQLAFRSVPDHERPADSNKDNIYNFTVQATDDRYYGTLHVTVTVTPVNEAPTITTTARLLRRCVTRRTAPPASTPTGPRTRSGAPLPGLWPGTHASFFTIDEQRGEFCLQ